MLKDITLGQYYPADSVIHKMDPRTKLLATVVYVVSLFVFRNIPGFIVATAVLIALVLLSKVPFKLMAKGLKIIWVLVAITAFFNVFFTPGDLLWQAGVLHITWQGVRNAVFFSIRLIYLILGTSIMTLTTTPNQLTDGLEKGLGCLNRVHVPVHEVAMMMSIALRFIPILLEEMDRIMKAQQARGADFESGNLIQRAKGLVPLLVPLFIAAIRRANDLAMAMEARCYHGGQGRTKMKPLHYEKRDRMAYLLMAVYMIAICVLRGVM